MASPGGEALPDLGLLFAKIFRLPTEQALRFLTDRIEADLELRKKLDACLSYRLSLAVGEEMFDIYLLTQEHAFEVAEALDAHVAACGGSAVREPKVLQALMVYTIQRQALLPPGRVKWQTRDPQETNSVN